MKLYHYSNTKIENIDLNKCDGFWMTDIAPTDTDMMNEVGCAGSAYCHVIEFNDNAEFETNGPNSDIEDFLTDSDCEYLVNRYDGFSDYVTVNLNLVKIVQVIAL